MTSRLGDEIRSENVKMQEAFANLQGVARGAGEAARSMSSAGPALPPGLPDLAAARAAPAQLDGRTTTLTSTVQTLTADFNFVRVQVADLVSAVGALQNATHALHRGPFASDDAVDAFAGAANGLERDSLDGQWEACVPPLPSLG